LNVTDAVRTRRTIRAFKKEPVPESVLRDVLDIAREAPSNSNTQPWRIDIVSGEARVKLQQAIADQIQSGAKPNPAFPPGGSSLTFDAPHAAFLSYPKTMHRANALDMGIFMQTIMLLFVERGIASCPQGALAAYPDPVKAMLPIPKDNAILCGLSFGYPDMEAQINSAAAKMSREDVDVFASFTQ